MTKEKMYKKKNRTRLTAVYFFDRGPTRTLTLSKFRVFSMFLLGGSVLTGCVMGAGLTCFFWYKSQQINNRMTQLKISLFQYQVQHEDVFKWAYPDAIEKLEDLSYNRLQIWKMNKVFSKYHKPLHKIIEHRRSH